MDKLCKHNRKVGRITQTLQTWDLDNKKVIKHGATFVFIVK